MENMCRNGKTLAARRGNHDVTYPALDPAILSVVGSANTQNFSGSYFGTAQDHKRWPEFAFDQGSRR
jgi:hypothetical protein